MKFLGIFASVKITNVLLPVLIGEMIVFSFFPNPRSLFQSVLFLFPLLLFLFNITGCTLVRLGNIKFRRAPLKAGPDVIHFGIIFLVVLGLLTPFLRDEASFSVREGVLAVLPGGIRLEVDKLDFSTYENGRPERWIAEIRLDGRKTVVEVNRPARVGNVFVYLTSFGTVPEAELNCDRKIGLIDLSGGLELDDGIYKLLELKKHDDLRWELVLTSGNKVLHVFTGETFQGVTINDIFLRKEARLMIVVNPLRRYFIVVFMIIGAGLIVTAADKIFGRRK